MPQFQITRSSSVLIAMPSTLTVTTVNDLRRRQRDWNGHWLTWHQSVRRRGLWSLWCIQLLHAVWSHYLLQSARWHYLIRSRLLQRPRLTWATSSDSTRLTLTYLLRYSRSTTAQRQNINIRILAVNDSNWQMRVSSANCYETVVIHMMNGIKLPGQKPSVKTLLNARQDGTYLGCVWEDCLLRGYFLPVNKRRIRPRWVCLGNSVLQLKVEK